MTTQAPTYDELRTAKDNLYDSTNLNPPRAFFTECVEVRTRSSGDKRARWCDKYGTSMWSWRPLSMFIFHNQQPIPQPLTTLLNTQDIITNHTGIGKAIREACLQKKDEHCQQAKKVALSIFTRLAPKMLESAKRGKLTYADKCLPLRGAPGPSANLIMRELTKLCVVEDMRAQKRSDGWVLFHFFTTEDQ